MDSEKLKKQIDEQMNKAFWDIILEDLNSKPPKTDYITKLLNEIIDILCSFNPNKTKLNDNIKSSLKYDNVIEMMPEIINNLINWIEKFQQPACDYITNNWKIEFKNYLNNDYENITHFIIKFLKEYYSHILKIRKDVYNARERIINGESVIPPEHRIEVKGNNGIPDKINTGK